MKTQLAFILFAALLAAAPGTAQAQTNIGGQPTWTSCITYQFDEANYGPRRAFDRNVDTKWVAPVPAGGCYVDFYLGGYRHLAQVTIKHAKTGTDTWETMNTVAYSVSYLSGGAYYQVASVYNPTYESVTTSYINVYTDYLRIWITDPGDADNLLRIPEIEVYLWGGSNPDPGTGRIGWPFSGDKGNRGLWAQITGSSLHVGDDQYAEDWAAGASTCGAPFYAPIAGTVIYAGNTGPGSGFASYGNQIVIRSSINRDYALRVAHLQNGSITKAVGSVVSAGELIGRVGNTPNWSTCHAHIAVYKDIKAVSPVNGLRGVDNLRVGSSPSGAITTWPASPFPMRFNPNAPGRPWNP